MDILNKIKGVFTRSFRYIFAGVPIKHVTAKISVMPRNKLLKDRKALVTGGSS